MRIVIIGQAAFGDAVFQKLLEQGDEVVGVFYEREDDPLHSRRGSIRAKAGLGSPRGPGIFKRHPMHI